jgi:hypothetical protein
VQLSLNDPVTSLSIAFRLSGDGRSVCTVRSGDASCELGVVWLFEMLGKMALAAATLQIGGHSLSIGYEGHTGEQRWVMNCDGSNSLNLNVLGFDAPRSYLPNSAGRLLFTAHCTRIGFARAVDALITATLADPDLRTYSETTFRYGGIPQREIDYLKWVLSLYPFRV